MVLRTRRCVLLLRPCYLALRPLYYPVVAAQMWVNGISRKGNGLFILTGFGETVLYQSGYICEETKNTLH